MELGDKGRDLVRLGSTISGNTPITSWRVLPMAGGFNQLVFSISSLPTLLGLFLLFRFESLCLSFAFTVSLVSEKIHEVNLGFCLLIFVVLI